MHYAQLIGKLARLLDELEQHGRTSAEHTARLQAEIDATRAALESAVGEKQATNGNAADRSEAA